MSSIPNEKKFGRRVSIHIYSVNINSFYYRVILLSVKMVCQNNLKQKLRKRPCLSRLVSASLLYLSFPLSLFFSFFLFISFIPDRFSSFSSLYWVTQKLPQICTILRIRIWKVVWFAVYICGNFWVTQYVNLHLGSLSLYLCMNPFFVFHSEPILNTVSAVLRPRSLIL